MTREEGAKFLAKTIGSMVAGGIHQLDIVALLEAHKFNLLMQAHEQNAPRIQPASAMPLGVLNSKGN